MLISIITLNFQNYCYKLKTEIYKEKICSFLFQAEAAEKEKLSSKMEQNSIEEKIKSCDKTVDQSDNIKCDSNCQCSEDMNKLTLNQKPDMSKLEF